ncbi:hypothetical protein BJX63DRAFT_378336 [Aspergillus granulosus]|uniref:Uncharacterized protein n=1 Tax=Aspergillus granulosus TaxID=176169 RepID=A0ABR4I172_9EURO
MAQLQSYFLRLQRPLQARRRSLTDTFKYICILQRSLYVPNIRPHIHCSSPAYKLAYTLTGQSYTTASKTPHKMTTPAIEPRYLDLFQKLEARIANAGSIPNDKWAILTIATLVAGPDPERVDQLYLYLTSQPRYATSESRKALVRRLREALFKAIIIVGVPKPIEAIVAIAKVEKDEDKDLSPPTRGEWTNDKANHERGVGWFSKVYTRNGGETLDLFNAHKDFSWLSTEITYGLFLSDRQVLDDLDTQLVVLPAIMSQNLPKETNWHIRGTRRLGVPIEDVKIVTECVKLVSEFYGVTLDKVPSVEEVEKDV